MPSNSNRHGEPSEEEKHVHNQTPIIKNKSVDHFSQSDHHIRTPSRNQSIVSHGSEQVSNLGDITDQIGFVLCLDHEQAVGITVATCQFLYFNYGRTSGKVEPRKLHPVTITGEPMDRVPSDVLQVVEVKNQDSITAPFVVVASEGYIDIFTLDYG